MLVLKAAGANAGESTLYIVSLKSVKARRAHAASTAAASTPAVAGGWLSSVAAAAPARTLDAHAAVRDRTCLTARRRPQTTRQRCAPPLQPHPLLRSNRRPSAFRASLAHAHAPQPLPEIDDTRAARRLEEALRAAEAASERIGLGVSRDAQALFDAISKTCAHAACCVLAELR